MHTYVVPSEHITRRETMLIKAEYRKTDTGDIACRITLGNKGAYCTHDSFDEGEFLYEWQRNTGMKGSMALHAVLRVFNVDNLLRVVATELIKNVRPAYKAGNTTGYDRGYTEGQASENAAEGYARGYAEGLGEAKRQYSLH